VTGGLLQAVALVIMAAASAHIEIGEESAAKSPDRV